MHRWPAFLLGGTVFHILLLTIQQITHAAGAHIPPAVGALVTLVDDPYARADRAEVVGVNYIRRSHHELADEKLHVAINEYVGEELLRQSVCDVAVDEMITGVAFPCFALKVGPLREGHWTYEAWQRLYERGAQRKPAPGPMPERGQSSVKNPYGNLLQTMSIRFVYRRKEADLGFVMVFDRFESNDITIDQRDFVYLNRKGSTRLWLPSPKAGGKPIEPYEWNPGEEVTFLL